MAGCTGTLPERNSVSLETYKMKDERKEYRIELIFLGAVFIFLLLWAVVQPFNASPDEAMRYQIVDYIVRHGTLPHGGDPEIRDAMWGISYGFNPILPYIFSAGFAKITSFFTSNEQALLIAARMVNVLLGTGFAFLVRQIARQLFPKPGGWFFTLAVTFLPGCMFIFSYVNTDGLALFSTGLIILMWVRAFRRGWERKTCAGLGIGIGLCAMSYYNAYGVIIASILFFCVTVLLCREKKWDIRFLLTRGLLITGFVAAIAGWWFIRSYLIYDGDILGMRTSSQYAEMYAVEELKPSNRQTIQSTGMSVLQMMAFVPGDWQHNWLVTVMVSFIGTFGFMKVFMPFLLSKLYILLFGVGGAGILTGIRRLFFVRRDSCDSQKVMIGQERAQVKVIYRRDRWNAENVFRWALLVTMIVPPIVLTWYAYSSDFQAQGRYVMPAVIPIMYFVTLGYEQWFKKIRKAARAGRWFFLFGSLFFVISAVYTYAAVFLPSCR